MIHWRTYLFFFFLTSRSIDLYVISRIDVNHRCRFASGARLIRKERTMSRHVPSDTFSERSFLMRWNKILFYRTNLFPLYIQITRRKRNFSNKNPLVCLEKEKEKKKRGDQVSSWNELRILSFPDRILQEIERTKRISFYAKASLEQSGTQSRSASLSA